MRNFALALLIALAGSSTSPVSADDSPINALQPHKFGPRTVFGRIQSVSGTTLVLQRRNGTVISTDISAAVQYGAVGPLYLSRPVALHGAYDRQHIYHVNAITSANGLRFGENPTDE